MKASLASGACKASRRTTKLTTKRDASCVSRGAVGLDAQNQVYFGATGDLSSLWSGAPCECQGAATGGVCRTPPACPDQQNCGRCVEVTCNFEGRQSFQGDGVTHNELCRAGTSVVVQLIDACPHNHPNNAYWCTERRKDHIDVSCSADSTPVCM